MNCLSLIYKYTCLPISQPLFTKPCDIGVKSKRDRKVLSISIKALLSKSILFIISYNKVFFIPALHVLTRVSFESYIFLILFRKQAYRYPYERKVINIQKHYTTILLSIILLLATLTEERCSF